MLTLTGSAVAAEQPALVERIGKFGRGLYQPEIQAKIKLGES